MGVIGGEGQKKIEIAMELNLHVSGGGIAGCLEGHFRQFVTHPAEFRPGRLKVH